MANLRRRGRATIDGDSMLPWIRKAGTFHQRRNHYL